MQYAGLDETQAGIKITERNINNQVHESRQIGSGRTRDGKSER